MKPGGGSFKERGAGEERLASLDARDRVLEVADDPAHRLEQAVLEAKQLVELAAGLLDPPVCVGAGAQRGLFGAGDDRARSFLCRLLDLVGAAERVGHRPRQLALLLPVGLDLDSRRAQLGLEVAREENDRADVAH